MHELSISMSIIDEVERIREAHAGARICKIALAIGLLSGIEREALAACFPLAAEGTSLEHAELLIKELPVEVECQSCGRRAPVAFPNLCCTACGSFDTRVMQGYEMIIESLELENE